MVKSQFKQLFDISSNPEHPLWSNPENWDDPNFAILLLDVFENEMEASGSNIALMQARARAFVSDLIALRIEKPEYEVLCDFLQFEVSTKILSFLSNNKLFSYCFDWICNSISDDLSTERQRSISETRLITFTTSENKFIQGYFYECFIEWTQHLFYYSRCTGGHNDLCLFYLKHYFSIFLKATQFYENSTTVKALSQISTWCFNHKDNLNAKRCNERLLDIYNRTASPQLKMEISFFFSCAKRNDTGLSRREWAKLVKNQYYDRLKFHEKFQLLTNLYDEDIQGIRENFTEIIWTIQRYSEDNFSASDIVSQYHNNRIFSLLEMMMFTLLSHGEVEKVNQIIAAFFSISTQNIIKPQNLYIIPNTFNGVLYAMENDTICNDADSKNNIPQIIDIGNSFSGITNALFDDHTFIFHVADRPGVPDKNFGKEYYNAIINHFEFKKLLYLGGLNKCNGFFLNYGIQLPLQNIISSEIGVTIPLIHSFCNPLNARTISKVFIWQGFTQMAEIERIGLEEIFTNFDINIVWANCFESSKEIFFEAYLNADYDVFWVIGHGEFILDESHLSYLDLGNGISVSISDLKEKQYVNEKRRLVVLDTCDSATTALVNNPTAIGIGAAMVSSSQSVIGHNWPVENISSLTLGLLLSSYLVQGLTYEQSHCKTINLFKSGKKTVIEHLKPMINNSDVTDRIVNSSMEFDNFYYWGSMVLFI